MIEEVKKVEENRILSTDYVEKELEVNPYGHFIVYKKDNNILGYLYYSIIYDRIEINQIEVLEEERRKGIASKLMEYLIKDNLSITLEVKETNYAAIKLYKKYGFLEVAKRRGYYNGVDGILMEKRSDK